MNLQLEAPVLALEAGQIISLDDACGTSIQAQAGTVWITEEGEPRDFVVGPGEAFLVTRPGRTLVQAMAAAHVALRDEDVSCVPEKRLPLEPTAGSRDGDDFLLDARSRAHRAL